MGVYKLSANSVKNGRTIYGSMLAGNTAFLPTSFESIATVTVGSGGAANVEFTSIPATYTHLQVRIMARASNAANLNGMKLNINGDTNANYAFHLMYGNGSNVGAEGYGSQSYGFMGNFAAANQNSNVFAVSVIDILDYANTNKYKTVRALTGDDNNDSTNYGYISLSSSLWRSTSAITSLTFDQESSSSTTNWSQYSHFALYGIKGV
jgi:hypothetical protein